MRSIKILIIIIFLQLTINIAVASDYTISTVNELNLGTVQISDVSQNTIIDFVTDGTFESELYNKSRVLYGLFQSKKEIRQEDNCYLVEGYTDVISMHQTGVKNVVSSSGTALSEDQVKLIKRYTQNVTVLYDGDAPGIRASFRGIDILLEGGLNVRAVTFPNGEDPDSYSRKLGATAYVHFLTEGAVDFIKFKTSLSSVFLQNCQ